jgi:tyrosinase
MSHAVNTSSFADVCDLLKKAVEGDASAFGGLALWDMKRDGFLAAKLGGLPLVVLPGKKTCCSSAPADVGSSALLRGLRGESPFDNVQYPRLPWGKAPLTPEFIVQIEDWLREGAPENETPEQAAIVTIDDWTVREQARLRVEPAAYSDAQAAFSEYQGSSNEYRYARGELRQRMNLDCMSEAQLERLRYAFSELYALNDWPDDARNYNNIALIHQNHCQHGWERFLPWHRIYLYELEQILQDICPDVTLPYWDFTMPQYVPEQPDKGEIIPPSFKAFLRKESLPFLAAHGIPTERLEPLVGVHFARQSDFFDAVGKAIGFEYTDGKPRERFIDALLAANALWYPLRYPGQYGGKTINQAIHYHYPTADDMAQILSLRTFRDFGGGPGYDDAFGFLDQNPHNTMHIWTGGFNPQAPKHKDETKDRNKSVQVVGRRFHKKSDLYTQPPLGDMFSNLTASYDPVFWPIHVNIDRVWHEWQEMNPNSFPADLDSVLTPWSYTIRDTLDMRRFGYEYVKSTCLLPVGVASPVARFVSKPLDIAPTVRASFRTAEVRLHRVPQLPRSGFVRVFLNLADANANTPIDHPNYAGYLAIFGHGDCIGGPGHCAVPQAGKYNLRPRSHNTPRNHRVNVTKCARALFDAGASTLTITLVVIGADYEEDQELLRLDGVSLNFLD